MLHALILALSLSLTVSPVADLQKRLGARIPPSSGGVLQPADITLVGALRTKTHVCDTNFAYGGIAYRLGPDGHDHVFISCNFASKKSARVDSGASTTVFTLAAGQGVNYAVGQSVNMARAAAGNALPDNTRITNISTDTITVSPALGGTPRPVIADTIASGASTTVFTMTAGQGADFAVNDAILVCVGGIGCGGNSATTVITNIATDVITVSPALTFSPAAADGVIRYDLFFRDSGYVDELDLNGLTPSMPYTSAPEINGYKNWGDVYQGHKVTWTTRGALTGFNDGDNLLPGSLNFINGMLYWCYGESYTTVNLYSCGGTTLDNVGTGAMTSYGPWQMTMTDGDGAVHTGSGAAKWLQPDPTGKMLIGSSLSGGVSQFAWGPNLTGGGSCATCTDGWPGTSTPSGLGSAALNQPDRYLYYYYMGDCGLPNCYAPFTSILQGVQRSYGFNDIPYVYEPGYENPGLDANPTLNGGVGTWTELDRNAGCIWFDGTNKDGILCANVRVGGTQQVDPTLCDGDFGPIPYQATRMHSHPAKWYETPTDSHIYCSHGCAPAIVVTGPQTNVWYPTFDIFNPADANAVAAGSKTDYTVVPDSVTKLESAYSGFTISPPTINGGGNHAVGGLHGTTFYSVATLADATTDPGSRLSIIYVWSINDSAPAPSLTAASWLLHQPAKPERLIVGLR